MLARGFDHRRCLVAALPFAAACSLILDFEPKDDAGPIDAPAPDARLVPEPCDVGEPNASTVESVPVVTGENRFAAICPAGDRDFYRITLTGTELLSFTILFNNRDGAGDLQLRLVDSVNTIANSLSFDDNETIVCPGTAPDCPQLAAGDYFAEVYGALPTIDNLYQLDVQISAIQPVDAGVDAL